MLCFKKAQHELFEPIIILYCIDEGNIFYGNTNVFYKNRMRMFTGFTSKIRGV